MEPPLAKSQACRPGVLLYPSNNPVVKLSEPLRIWILAPEWSGVDKPTTLSTWRFLPMRGWALPAYEMLPGVGGCKAKSKAASAMAGRAMTENAARARSTKANFFMLLPLCRMAGGGSAGQWEKSTAGATSGAWAGKTKCIENSGLRGRNAIYHNHM